MKFTQRNKLELGDTLVPDLFILNNLKTLQGNDIKIYLYLNYLLKMQEEVDSSDVIKFLGLSADEFKNSIEVLVAEELVTKTSRGYIVVNLKEAEINKSFTPKFDNKVKKVNPEDEEKRQACIEALEKCVFNGPISLSWYSDISNLFNVYNFDEEIIVPLFNYCLERKALNRKYLFAVAETWHNAGVRNLDDLDRYTDSYEKLNKIKNKISKALAFGRSLSKFEEAYVKKWLDEYHYDYDIIEEAMRRSTSTYNPSIKYIDAIISSWYKKGYTELKEILEEENAKEESATQVKKVAVEPKKKSFQNYSTKREYDSSEDFYDDLD